MFQEVSLFFHIIHLGLLVELATVELQKNVLYIYPNHLGRMGFDYFLRLNSTYKIC